MSLRVSLGDDGLGDNSVKDVIGIIDFFLFGELHNSALVFTFSSFITFPWCIGAVVAGGGGRKLKKLDLRGNNITFESGTVSALVPLCQI